MRIGLISDTHGWLDPRVEHHFSSCDEIWHAGDIGSMEVADQLGRWKPLRAVRGNIDGPDLRQRFPEHMRATVEGVRVWMTHIGGRPPRYDRAVIHELRQNPPDLFICGHSHICMVRMDEQLPCLYMNPGAAGRHGWHRTRTLLRFRLENSRPRDLEVIELGPRGAV
ncbi:MAG: metallophosphoesterase family protein [Flavobacteriales bacterium]|nr:metallophosphoesterase family protein [Flavobacteriales bacterium]